MRSRAADVGLALLALALSACAGSMPIGEPPVFPAPAAVSAAHVRGAVLAGLTARHFVPEAEGPGAIVARFSARSLWVQVRVDYAADRYGITYLASEGLGESIDEAGVRRIHSRYHRYIDRLRLAIDAGFARPMMTAGGVMPPAPSPPSELVPQPPGAYGAAQPVPVLSDPNAVPAPPDPNAVPAPMPPPAGPVAVQQPASAVTPFVALAPVEPPPAPRPRGPTHPAWELAGTGAVLLAAGWIANWGVALGVGGPEGAYIGLSFLPIAGPWAQLPTLQWSIHPRWTGVFHPVMAGVQIVGLVLLIAGATIRVSDREEPSAERADLRWTLTPVSLSDGAGLAFDLQF